MRVLHLIWNKQSSRFIIWAESSELLKDILNEKSKKSNFEKLKHPYCLGAEETKKIIINEIPQVKQSKIPTKVFFIPLPTLEIEKNKTKSTINPFFPIPSPQLEKYLLFQRNKAQAFSSEKNNKNNIIDKILTNIDKFNPNIQRYYKIEAIEIPPEEILNIIILSGGDLVFENSNENYNYGPSFRFWQECLLFIINLLVKNRYFPIIAEIKGNIEDSMEDKKEFLVTWNMSLTTTLSENFYNLLYNIPPLCHTIFYSNTKEEEEYSGRKKQKVQQIPSKKVNQEISEMYYDPEDYLRQSLNQILDIYIRKTFNSSKKNISKNYIIEKMSIQDINQRTDKDQKLIKKMAEALFLETSTPIVLPSNINKRYKRYLSLTQTTSEMMIDKSFFTCFKIEPPKYESEGNENENIDELVINKKNGKEHWFLDIYIQTKMDLSLIFPAEEIWNNTSEALKYLNYKFTNPQEQILTDIGRVRKTFPFMDRFLEYSKPSTINLSTEETYSLIEKAHQLLEFEGIKIIIPPEFKRSTAQLGLILQLQPLSSDKKTEKNKEGKEKERKSKGISNISSGKFGLNSIIEYNWKVALGDKILTKKEFNQLAKLKVPLLKIRGNWVEVSRNNIQKIQEIFKKQKLLKKSKTPKSKNKSTKKIPSGTPIEIFGINSDKDLSGTMAISEAIKMEEYLYSQEDNINNEMDGDIPLLDIRAEKELNSFLTQFKNHEKISIIKKVPNLNGTLRDYQNRGVSWLKFMKNYGIGACLADDMGLGKTIQVISLLLYEKKYFLEENESSKALIICPMSILGNWKKEINRFAPSLSVFIHHGDNRLTVKDLKYSRNLGKQKGKTAKKNKNSNSKHNNINNNINNNKKQSNKKGPYDVILTTYSLARRDESIFNAITWNTLVLDESQNIKNHQAKRTISIKKFKAKHKIALTGTPIENRLLELWSLMDFLNPQYLNNISHFNKEYIKPIERYRDINKSYKLKKIIQPFILRRLKTDKNIIKDLPEKQEIEVFCTLTKEQATLYEAVVKEMIEKIENSKGIERKGLILATITKLKQICNHPAQFLHALNSLKNRSGKLSRLGEMVGEAISEGDKVLVFTQYKEMGKIIQIYLNEKFKIEAPFLHGGVPQKKREEMIDNFQSEKMEFPVFIISVKAGGTGLNLTAANHVFHYDRWWNPAVEDQATDRAYRIGQTKNVNVYKYSCSGTIEEKISEIIESKKELADNIIGTGESWITEFSTEDLKKLFQLSENYI